MVLLVPRGVCGNYVYFWDEICLKVFFTYYFDIIGKKEKGNEKKVLKYF